MTNDKKPPLLELDAALEQICQALSPVNGVERVPTFSALGRVLAADIVSSLDLPPLDTSAMDGYAVRCADVDAVGARLPVSQRVAAGQVGQPLADGSAVRIFTGAPLPAGADAVVMQERCVPQGDHVRIDELPRPGQHVRRQGEDVGRDARVLATGQRITPAAMGLAASVGCASVEVRRRVRVAMLSTGDELVMPGEPLPPGGIYNSNRFLLRGLIEAAGAQCCDFGIVADDLAATREALRQAASDHDLVVTTGGVSVGEADHLKAAVRAEGELALWQIAIKPGKPLAFGRISNGAGGPAHFIGLPGNPVAAFVTFLLVVRPALMRLSGRTDGVLWPVQPLRSGFTWSRPDRLRREFLRGRREADGSVSIHPQQGSAALTATAWADGLVDLPAGQEVRVGDGVRFLPFAELWG